jgi:hypothetical protein
MLRNRKGFGSITLYLGVAIVVIIVVSGAVIWGQYQKIERLKSENDTLVRDNNTIQENCVKQRGSDAETIEYYQTELRNCLAREQEPCETIESKDPDIKIIKNESEDAKLKELNDLWRIQ